jgi:hypothetical protein
MIIGRLVIADPIVVATQRRVTNGAWGRAVSSARPVVGVRATADGDRAVAHRIVAIEEGVVVAGSIAVIVAIAVWIVGPSRITGADENRSAGSTAVVSDSITGRTGTVVKWIVIAGADDRAQNCSRDKEIFFHINRVTMEPLIYSSTSR